MNQQSEGTKTLYTKWKEIVAEAGVLDGTGISDITVRQIPGPQIDDVVLCPAADADRRIGKLTASRGSTRMQPERVFLARTLRNDAETAVALLVRAVIGQWAHARGRRTLDDANERRTWEVLHNHLQQHGHPELDVTAGRGQIAQTHIKAPVAHEGVADVVRKAIAQIAKQIDGRHVIVMGSSPLAV